MHSDKISLRRYTMQLYFAGDVKRSVLKNHKYIPNDIYLDNTALIIYTNRYRLTFSLEVIMDTAKLFINGRSQAVRLPKSYRFEGKEVYVKKVSEGVLLLPKDNTIWDVWEKNLRKYDKPFITERNQPQFQQEREGLDAIFD